MTKTIFTIATVSMLTMMLSGCAQDNYNSGYNSYDNRSYQDRKLDYAAQDAMNDATSKLSAQDIKNINNLK